MTSLKDRLAAIEAKMRKKPRANGFHILLIEGGAGEIRHAYAGSAH
jgi:hypothetical protein